MEYFHDNAGRCLRELVKLSEGTCQEICYVLDETGRVWKRFEKLETDAVSPAGIGYAVTEYHYDGNSNITKNVLT